MCRFLDLTPAVIEWASESIVIGYINPLTGKAAKYYPDFLFKYKDNSGNIVIELVEIKPYKQTIPPKSTKGKNRQTLITEAKMWAVNQAKWKAAKVYCDMRSIVFRIMTEKELNIH